MIAPAAPMPFAPSSTTACAWLSALTGRWRRLIRCLRSTLPSLAPLSTERIRMAGSPSKNSRLPKRSRPTPWAPLTPSFRKKRRDRSLPGNWPTWSFSATIYSPLRLKKSATFTWRKHLSAASWSLMPLRRATNRLLLLRVAPRRKPSLRRFFSGLQCMGRPTIVAVVVADFENGLHSAQPQCLSHAVGKMLQLEVHPRALQSDQGPDPGGINPVDLAQVENKVSTILPNSRT